MSGMFEVLAAAPDEERLARQAAQDKLAAAVYDVRQQFGPFLFAAADIREFRDRVALVRTDILNVVARHLPPVSGVMGRIITRRGAILEKEFKSRQAMRKGAPSSGNEDDGRLHGPFAGYDDWEDCTSQNSDKGDPSAYCGEIYHNVEDGRKDKGEPLTNFQDKESKVGFYPPQTIDDIVRPSPISDPETRRRWEELPPPGQLNPNDKPRKRATDERARYIPEEEVAPSDDLHGDPGPFAFHTERPKKPFGPPLPPERPEHLSRRRRATGDGPPLDTDVTFQDHQGEELIPEGNFPAYLDSVDQGARSKIDDNFVDNPKGQEHTEAVTAAKVTRQFVAFCRRHQLPVGLSTLERHGKKMADRDYLAVAADLQRLGWDDPWDYDDYGAVPRPSEGPHEEHKPIPEPAYRGHPGDYPPPKSGPPEPDYFHPGKYPYAKKGRRRHAAPDFLQKAQDALTGYLTQQGEQFQETIAPYQQMLQTIQQSQALQQAQNPAGDPLGVTLPGGVNVLPSAPGGAPGAGADPSGGAAAGGLPPVDPTGGGADPTAAPPAAADAGAMPPDPTADPGQTLARRGRGGHPKGEPRSGGVVDEFQNWMSHSPGLGRGGEPDVEEFANTHQVGDRAKEKLRQHVVTPVTASVKRQAWMGWGPQLIDPPMRKVSGWDWDNQLEAYVARQPGRFACSCGNQLDMPGHHTCKCGKIWNGYDIEGGGSHHEASGPTYLVREIPVRPDVIVAAGPKSVGVPSTYGGGSIGSPDALDDGEWPSDHHPKVPDVPATPPDWARRNIKNDYAPQQLKKRRR